MEKVKRNRIINIILCIFQGLVIGVSGILPGISGGVLCIVFGIYKPFMEILASPLSGIKAHWRRLLPVGIGAGVGFFMLVKAVSTLIEEHEALATAAFAGLILGTLPSLIRAAGKEKRTWRSYTAFFVSFILFFVLFVWLKLSDGFSVAPNFLWFAVAGAIWGLSIVLPGLSSSAILIFLGLFGPIAEGAISFDFSVLFPLAVGGVGSLILFAKLINLLYEKHFSVMSHVIIGIVVATTLPILPTNFISASDAFVQISLVILGCVCALVFDNISTRVK